MPHFIDIKDHDATTLQAMIDRAIAIKQERAAGESHRDLLTHKQVAMIFEKSSTRTRISFEVGIRELGAEPLVLNSKDMQLGRGETVEDTAKVLSRYVDAIMLRCNAHSTLVELAAHGTVPVINGLSDYSHPCQVMTDIMTYQEHRGPIAGKKVAWLGDGNNMVTSWMHAAEAFGFALVVASPEAYTTQELAGKNTTLTTDTIAAATDADLVTTDTWVSMGDADAEARHAALAPYQVDDALMQKAKDDALFMHCLPAHRGEEATASVMDGPQSVIFDEAENRLHCQKAILLHCFGVL